MSRYQNSGSQSEWRTGPEHGLHGGRDELRGLRVDDDVPA